MARSPVPPFRLLPVLVWGLLLYLLMAAFFGVFFGLADVVRAEAARAGAGAALRAPHLPGWTVWSELGAGVVGIAAVLWWHRPLARTFRAWHAGATPSPQDLSRAQAQVFRSPLVVGALAPGVLGVVLVGVTAVHLHPQFHGSGLPPETRALPVNLVLLVLSGMFISLWQRHRIQTKYLPHLFPTELLTTKLPPVRDTGIRSTLVLLAGLAAVLPVAIVLLLLATGVSNLDPTTLSPDQWALALGSETYGRQVPGLLAAVGLDRVPVLLVNTLDTWRILVGSVLGVGFMLGYVFLVYHWVAGDLLGPLYALRDAMKRVEEGEAVAPLPVVTSNEVGQLTLGFNQMVRGLGERDRIKGLFGQYLTTEVSQAILDGRVNLGGDRYDVTVLFTDIRDFTALSDQLPPEDVFAFLNGYLDAMIEVLVARGGFIDKFLGDGILTVFGLPVRSDTHAEAAFLAARDMQTKLADLNAARTAAGRPAIAIGSGLHSGPVIAGNVGSSRKLQYTVIGDTVNLASRIESLNKRWASSVTLSAETWSRLPDNLRGTLPFVVEKDVEIRGKKDPITLYRLD